MELICGACHGRLLAELPGTTVACPHCGAHLHTPPAPVHDAEVPAEAFAFLPSAAGGTAGPADTALPASPVSEPASVKAETLAPVASPAVESAGAGSTATDPIAPADERADDSLKTTVVGFVVNVAREAAESPAAAPAGGTAESAAALPPTASEILAGTPVADTSAVTEPAAAVALTDLHSEGSASLHPREITAARKPSRAAISPMLFMIVVSYASAVTLACLYLVFLLLSNPRTLDLPDLAPPQPKDKKKVTSLIYLSPDQEIPPANVLKLGQSRQYGSLNVTPLCVTRGPVEFQYYQTQADQQKEIEGPVLKLHLRFENVSRDQEFIPLDSKLVFSKEIDRKAYGLLKANNFVCNVADRNDPARQVFMFDLTPNGKWLLKGENLDRELVPGQVLETFVPTTSDQIDSLSGDLVWRVHFRKGYNRISFRGVTTLIEVLFNKSDIVNDEEPVHVEPAPPAQDEPANEEPAEA